MSNRVEDAGSYISTTVAVTRVRGGGYGNDAWIARITGADPKWGFSRVFCKRDKSGLSGSGKSGSVSFAIDGDGLYEFRNFCVGSTRKNWEWSGFVVIDKEEVYEITKEGAVKRAKEMEGTNGA